MFSKIKWEVLKNKNEEKETLKMIDLTDFFVSFPSGITVLCYLLSSFLLHYSVKALPLPITQPMSLPFSLMSLVLNLFILEHKTLEDKNLPFFPHSCIQSFPFPFYFFPVHYITIPLTFKNFKW